MPSVWNCVGYSRAGWEGSVVWSIRRGIKCSRGNLRELIGEVVEFHGWDGSIRGLRGKTIVVDIWEPFVDETT